MAAVVGDSLEHLQPWLPWATLDAADPGNQQARIAEAQQLWEAGSDYLYSVFAPDGTLAGSIGMHRRVGDGGMEIGYWISARAVGRGYATAAAAALTAEAKTLTGVERVEIHCDVANLASASIPRKLGYRMDRMEAHEPEAPGELGRRMIWVSDR